MEDGPGTTDGVGEGVNTCKLTISSINGRQVSTVKQLTADDDQDTTEQGIQIDVEVTGTSLADSTDVSLNVTALVKDPIQKSKGGKVTFKAVDVNKNLTSVVIRTYATGCSPDTVSLTVKPPPECVFSDPKDGQKLPKSKDKNPGTTSFDYDVVVATDNASGGEVTLFIDSAAQTPVKPDAAGIATFADKILSSGNVELKAEVKVGTVKRTCTASVKVDTNAPSCKPPTFKPTAATTSKSYSGLGIKQDKTPTTTGLQTDIVIETDGDTVELFIDGTSQGTNTGVTGTSTTFADKSIADGNHDVYALCTSTGSGLTAQSASAAIWVDTQEPEELTDFTCKVSDNRAAEVTCTWTSVTDPGGIAASGLELYQVRYLAGSKITSANWSTATKLTDQVPLAKGQTQTLVIKSLDHDQTYHFGIMPVDYVLNESSKGPFTIASELTVDFHENIRDGVAGAKSWGQIMTAGDYNCDGFTDVAVGDPQMESGKGKVYIYSGTALGLSQQPWHIYSGTVAGGSFGAGVATLKNFDKDSDNCDDLAVWASHGGSSNKGRVFVYLGRKTNFFDREDVTTGLGAELIYELAATAASTEVLGAHLSAGDFDGDGATDLAVSHADTATTADSTDILVIYGDSTLTLMSSGKSPTTKVLPAAAGVKITGGKHSEDFAAAMTYGAMLTSGDSYADFVIGAAKSGTSGAVFVVKGGARASTLPEEIKLTDTRVLKISGGSSNVAFGSSVAFVGDMDNDKSAEFAVGDPGYSSSLGTVYLFNLGGTTAPSSASDAVATVTNDVPGASSDKFGLAIGDAAVFDPSGGADIDHDGYADLVASSETAGSAGVGAVFVIGNNVLTGLKTSAATFEFDPAGTTSFGTPVVLAEDIDADKYVDILIGDTGYSSGLGRFFSYH